MCQNQRKHAFDEALRHELNIDIASVLLLVASALRDYSENDCEPRFTAKLFDDAETIARIALSYQTPEPREQP